MLKKLIQKLFDETNRNTLILLYGTVISQALPLVFSPVIARLYTPSDFGSFALFFGIVGVLGVMSAGKMDLALYTAKSKTNAIITGLTGMVFTGFFSLVILSVCFFTLILGIYGKLSFVAILFIPFTVFFVGCSQVLVALNNREKRFRNISRAKILLGVVWVVVNITYGIISPRPIGLIAGYFGGQLVSVLYLFFLTRKDLYSVAFNRKIFKVSVLRNKNYAFIFLPAHLLNTITTSAPTFFLSYLFGLNANGLYFKAARVGESPTGVIKNSLGNVFWQEASNDYLKLGNARPAMLRFLLRLSMFAFPGYLILFLFAEDLFVFLFGAPWIEAAVYFKILAPYFLLQFIITPVTIMIVLSNKPWIDIAWQICFALSVALSYGYGWLQNDVLAALQVYTILMSIMQLTSLGLNYYYSIKR